MASIDRENPEFAAEIRRRDMLDGMGGLTGMESDLPWGNTPARPPLAPHVPADETPVPEMRGQLTTSFDLFRFLLAGRAIITIQSRTTATRFTLRFSRPKEEPGRRRPIWVSVLTGPENNTMYSFAGTIWVDAEKWTYKHGRNSSLTEAAASVKAIMWMVKLLNTSPENLLRQAEVWHEGRCGRCGRRLTVPSSIESGFGPECAGKI